MLGKIEWDITDEHRLEASVYNYHENLTTGWQSLWWSEPGEAATVGRIKQRDYSVIYKYAPINNPWINLSAQYFHSKASYHRTRTGMVGTTKVDNDYLNSDRRWGVNLKNESSFDTWGIEHRLVLGGDYQHRKEGHLFLVRKVVQPSNSHPSQYKDLGFFIQDIFNIGKFEFTLGGRYDKFERTVKLDGREKYTQSRFSPKIAVAYEVVDGVNLLAGYAETFRAPTPHETSPSGALNPRYWYIPNSDLKPELAKEFELGFSVNREIAGDDNLYLKATYYNGKIRDMIAIIERPELGAPPFDAQAPNRKYAHYDNIDEAKRYGYELEAKYDIANFSFNLGYDHTKVYNAKTKKRIGVYADKLTFGGFYTYEPWRLTAGFDMAHYFSPARDTKTARVRENGAIVTKHYVDNSFTVANFRGSWAPKFDNKIFGSGLKIGFGVNNIFDNKYIHPDNYKDTTATGRGRNFYVDFEKKF